MAQKANKPSKAPLTGNVAGAFKWLWSSSKFRWCWLLNLSHTEGVGPGEKQRASPGVPPLHAASFAWLVGCAGSADFNLSGSIAINFLLDGPGRSVWCGICTVQVCACSWDSAVCFPERPQLKPQEELQVLMQYVAVSRIRSICSNPPPPCGAAFGQVPVSEPPLLTGFVSCGDGDRDPWETAEHQSMQGTTWHSPTADLVPERSTCTEQKWKKIYNWRSILKWEASDFLAFKKNPCALFF